MRTRPQALRLLAVVSLTFVLSPIPSSAQEECVNEFATLQAIP